VGLVIAAPVMLVVTILILVIDGRPVMFRQSRAGMYGDPFVIVKFRTMRRDADAQREELRALNEVAGGASFKMTKDPRVTPLGAWLRKTSIDELPQLWNVLLGHMSLVGPRPHPFDDVAGYAPWQFRRLSVKPGLTGLWQIEGRAEAEFDRWVEKDLQYIDGWSIWTDLAIILRTIPAILKRTGR
jgi:lipopolysaccharide/colanic/teichoic acid biosynthesis glycosyltransferase